MTELPEVLTITVAVIHSAPSEVDGSEPELRSVPEAAEVAAENVAQKIRALDHGRVCSLVIASRRDLFGVRESWGRRAPGAIRRVLGLEVEK